MYFRQKIRKNLKNDKAVVVAGMQRVGRTSLLRNLFKEI